MANTISPSSFRPANLTEILKAISPAVSGAPEMEAAATLLQTLNLSPDQWAQIAAQSALNTAALKGTIPSPLKTAVNPKGLTEQEAKALTGQIQQRALAGQNITVTLPTLADRNTGAEVDQALTSMAKTFDTLGMPNEAAQCRELAQKGPLSTDDLGTVGVLGRLQEYATNLAAQKADLARAVAAKATGSVSNAATSTATTSSTSTGGKSFQDQVESGSVFDVVPPEETITGKETDVELARKQQKLQKHALIMQMVTAMIAMDHETKKGIVQNWRA